MGELDYKLQSRASEKQKSAREKLLELFQTTPIPPEHLLVNLGLYMRSSVVAKFLYVNELYQQIITIPGVVMEFGVWWGQNLALFESFRAAYEPYNYTRKIIGFDTYEGYPSLSEQDGSCDLVKLNQYAVTENYLEHLSALLDYHQQENVMSHVRKYELVKGDATVTIGEYLGRHPETIISLAYFDMQLYEPTLTCLEAIKPYLVKGSVIAMDELNSSEFPGETVAFREAFGSMNFRLLRSRFLPDRSFAVIE
ncbi:MAG: TylF/MycF/NovP-related O-methyltransferase [Desulfuromonadales bacterium]